MPPKLPRRNSQNSPDNENLGGAFEQLCAGLKKGKTKKGQANDSSVIRNIQSILKSYRDKSQKVHNDVLGILVAAMDEGGGLEFCSQLEPAVFCIVIDTMLQADVCPGNKPQRGISCLSASLYRDSTDKDGDDSIISRKEYIGKECLGRLFKFFSDMSTGDAYYSRRWVGILIAELLRDSEENVEFAMLCSENDRRGIARVMLQDSDEHLQIVAGEIVKTLAEGGADLEDLWPLDEMEYCAGFPLTTTSRAGWMKSFMQWLDSIYNDDPQLTPQPSGEAFQVLSVQLTPPKAKFGAPFRMASLNLEDAMLAILTPAVDGNMIHILYASLSCLSSVDIIPTTSSDYLEVQIKLEVEENLVAQISIDAADAKLDGISFEIHVDVWKKLHNALTRTCPDIQIAFIELIEEELEAVEEGLEPAENEVEPVGDEVEPVEDEIDFVGSPETASVVIVHQGSVDAASVEAQKHDSVETTHTASAEVLRFETQELGDTIENASSIISRQIVTRVASVGIFEKGPSIPGVAGASTGRKLEISLKEVEIKVQKPSRPPPSAQPQSQARVVEVFEDDEDEQDRDLSLTKPAPASKDMKSASQTKVKSRNNIKPQAKPPITRISRPKVGVPEKKTPKAAAPSLPKSHTKLDQVQDDKVEEDVRGTKKQVTTQAKTAIKPSSQTSKSKVKVIGKPPVNRQGPTVKSTTKETKTPLNKQKASTSKDIFTIHADDDDYITDPEVSTSKPKQNKPRTPQDAANRADQAPQKKRYSLNGVRKLPALDLAAAPAKDVYAIPIDKKDDEKKKAVSKTPKQQIKPTPKTAASTGRIVKGKIPKAPAKPKAKRQSAPAALNEPTSPVRESKRAAAKLAKAKIHDLDEDDQESEDIPDADTPIQAAKIPKTGEPKKGGLVEAKIDNAVGSSSPDDMELVVENKKMPVNADSRTVMDSKKKRLAQGMIESDTKVSKKASKRSMEHIAETRAEENTGLDENQEGDAGAMPHEDFNILDNEMDMDAEPEPASEHSVETTTTKKPSKPAMKPKSSPVDKFADKLGNLLGDISDIADEAEMQSSAKSMTSIPVTTPAKLVFGADDLLNTSPFPPSSNLEGQASPRLVVRDIPDHSSGARTATATAVSAEVAPRILTTNDELASSQSQQDKPNAHAMPQVLQHEFRKPDIPMKAKPTGKDTKEKNKPESTKNHARAVSRDDVLDKTMQTLMESNILDNADELASSNTSHTDANPSKVDRRVQKKRKATTDLSPEPKRRLVAAKRVSQTNNAEITPKAKPTSHQKSEVPQGSSDLPARRSAKVNNEGTKESVTKDPARRPNLIHFDMNQGAVNQGHSSTKKTVLGKVTASGGVERKRKRDSRTAIDAVSYSPPKKRQHSSPVVHEPAIDLPEDDLMIYNDPPVRSDSLIAPSDRHRSRSSRQSSQPSRVDKNGSPIAIGRTDHIGKLKERLSQDAHPKSPHDQQTDSAAESLSEMEVGQGMFAARAQLSPKKKVRSLPQEEEVTSRYIAHEKTAQGQYRGINSLKIVATNAVVEDPFREPNDKHTPFVARLNDTKPAEVEKTLALATSLARLPSKTQARHSSPSLPARDRGTKQRTDPNITRNGSKAKAFRDLEKTLVNSHRHNGRQRSPEEMTNGSSPESKSSLAEDKMPLAEKWNMAIRPHFTTVHDAIHCIADEVIIRLSDEEDRMGLIVKQYDENGSAVLEKLLGKREVEKKTILQGLETKSNEMKKVYLKTIENIEDESLDLKTHPVADFEKVWHKRQHEIQKMMVAGVDSLRT